VCDFPERALRIIPGANPAAPRRLHGEAEENCAVMVAEQVRDFLENGNIRNSVNYPEQCCRGCEHHALSVANRNVPNMVGQISTASPHGDQHRRPAEQVARRIRLQLIDADGAVGEDLLANIRAIDGVLSARIV